MDLWNQSNKSPKNGTCALELTSGFNIHIGWCPRTFSNISPWDITSWGVVVQQITAVNSVCFAYTLNWINEEAPRCVTAMRRQQWIETDIHQGLLVDLISLCLPPRAVPENLKHHKRICEHREQSENSLAHTPRDAQKRNRWMATQWGGGSGFWKRGMRCISVVFVSEGNLMSERTDGVRCARVCHRGGMLRLIKCVERKCSGAQTHRRNPQCTIRQADAEKYGA